MSSRPPDRGPCQPPLAGVGKEKLGDTPKTPAPCERWTTDDRRGIASSVVIYPASC